MEYKRKINENHQEVKEKLIYTFIKNKTINKNINF